MIQNALGSIAILLASITQSASADQVRQKCRLLWRRIYCICGALCPKSRLRWMYRNSTSFHNKKRKWVWIGHTLRIYRKTLIKTWISRLQVIEDDKHHRELTAKVRGSSGGQNTACCGAKSIAFAARFCGVRETTAKTARLRANIARSYCRADGQHSSHERSSIILCFHPRHESVLKALIAYLSVAHIGIVLGQ